MKETSTKETRPLPRGPGEPLLADKRCRVLVVEDDADLRASIREAFLMRGLLVNVARDGKEALELAGDEHYDVVLTDVRMPRMDGIRLARMLPPHVENPKVIVMTAFPDWEVDEEARALGVVEIFSKPVNLFKLADAVERAANLSG